MTSSSIRVGGINYPSLNSSDGIALELYLSGCGREPKCKGCHNPELWSFDYGEEVEIDHIIKLIKSKRKLDNVVIMGGEPLHHKNLKTLLEGIKSSGKNIWLYTSYELKDITPDIKNLCDFIKTGEYIEVLRTKDEWLASLNQRIYKKEGSSFIVYYSPQTLERNPV